MLKKPIWEVLLGFLVLLVGRNTARCGEIKAWDAPVPAKGKELQTDQRADWKPLDKGDAKNCAVLGNGQLLLAVIPGSEGAIVYTKAGGARKETAVRLSFLDSKGNTVSPVRSIRLASHTSAEAVVQFTLGGGATVGQASNLSQVSLKLRAGRSFVEVADAQRIAGVRVGASMRFAFRPDLYGTDIFYAPTMAIFAGRNTVPLPVENYLLGVLSSDAAVLCTWGAGGQKASLNLAGTGPERQFNALDISLPDQHPERESVCVGFMDATGICRWEGLADTAAKSSGSDVVSLQPSWTAPFPARWYTLIYHDEPAGRDSSLHLPIVAWPLAGRIRAGKLEVWAKSGEMWTEDDRQHKPRRAAWYDGRRWGLDLEQPSGPFGVALNYPMGRVTQTPDSALTVIDLLRETLPESWEQVLDLKGLEQRGKYQGEGKMVMAPCAALYDLAKMAEDISAQTDTRAQAAALEAYLRAYQDRSQEYLAFSRLLRELCAGAARRSPPAAALSARLVAASREIDSEWERLKKEQGLDPGKWGPGVQQIYAVIDAWPADASKKLESLRGVIINPGTGYASFVAIARKVVRNLDYLAVYGGSENEETLKLSATVQELCHQELRNRYFKEDQYGESARGRLPNPERPTEHPQQ